jgi:hypothetical protein
MNLEFGCARASGEKKSGDIDRNRRLLNGEFGGGERASPMQSNHTQQKESAR